MSIEFMPSNENENKVRYFSDNEITKIKEYRDVGNSGENPNTVLIVGYDGEPIAEMDEDDFIAEVYSLMERAVRPLTYRVASDKVMDKIIREYAAKKNVISKMKKQEEDVRNYQHATRPGSGTRERYNYIENLFYDNLEKMPEVKKLTAKQQAYLCDEIKERDGQISAETQIKNLCSDALIKGYAVIDNIEYDSIRRT
jgi:predicted DNA-binding ribbon-helix-helix protein